MKRLSAVVLLGIATILGIFFVGGTPGIPLAVKIVGTNIQANGTLTFRCNVTNVTGQPYVFLTEVQEFTNELWKSQWILVSGKGAYRGIGSHSSVEFTVRAARPAGLMRVAIRYGKDKTPRQHQIDAWLKQVGLGPVFNDPVGGLATTTPTSFPPR